MPSSFLADIRSICPFKLITKCLDVLQCVCMRMCAYTCEYNMCGYNYIYNIYIKFSRVYTYYLYTVLNLGFF